MPLLIQWLTPRCWWWCWNNNYEVSDNDIHNYNIDDEVHDDVDNNVYIVTIDDVFANNDDDVDAGGGKLAIMIMLSIMLMLMIMIMLTMMTNWP